MKETCRTCKYKRVDKDSPYNDNLYCGNENSLCFGFNTVKGNYCREYEQNVPEYEVNDDRVQK